MSRISDLAGFSTALSTTQDLSVGVITATSFSGDGSALTGIAATDNINTATPVNVLNNVRITGFTTAGAVSASNLNVSGLSTFSGNVSIAGTLTYLDVTNVDSIGVITGRNGLDITGVGTFSSDIKLGPTAEITTSGTDVLSLRAASNHISLNTYSVFYPSGNVVLNNGGQGTTQIKNQVYVLSGITSIKNDVSVENDVEIGRNLSVTGVTTATTFKGELVGAAVTTSSAGLQASDVDFAGLLREQVTVTAGKLSDNTNINLADGMAHLFTTQETTTSTPNLRYNGSTTLNSKMAIGEAISVTIITTAASGGYSAQLTIDGSAVTEKWNGGSAPSAGGSSGNDYYTYNIIKTADATYTVLANVSNFA
jgi:cytoskeletal protein CcmA (bactofilin family)